MRILEHDELSSEMERQVHLLDSSVGWGVMDFDRIRESRRKGYPVPDYYGVYAVENGQVLSTVRVLALPFTTKDGTEIVAGIQGVVTRRDQGGKGMARELMAEVHRREKASRRRYSMLWTGRYQVAHGFYNFLGYQDVYTPDLAIKKCERGRRPKKLTLRKIRRSDAKTIEKLHRKSTWGGLGFTPRPTGFAGLILDWGFESLDDLKVIMNDDEPIGYVLLHGGNLGYKLDELVLLQDNLSNDAFSLIESSVGENWLTVRNTSVRDYRNVLDKRRYSFSTFSYYSLLALSLGEGRIENNEALGCDETSFTCQGLDYF